MDERGGRSGRIAGGLATILALLVLWYLATDVWRLVDPVRFPPPEEVYRAAVQLAVHGYAGGRLGAQLWQSTRLVLLGFAAAALTGVPLGLLIGWSRIAEALINPVFLVMRPIPPLAWIPLAIVWFGLGDASKIFVIWLAAFVPAVINAYTGVRTANPLLVAAARVHGARPWRVFAEIIVPGAMPQIFTGLRLSLQICWNAIVAAELLGAFFGIGRVLIIAQQDVYPGMIMFAMAWTAILGAGMTWCLSRAESVLFRWYRA